MVDFVISRLREPSTYAGLAGLAAAVGLSDAFYQAGASVVMAIAGLAAVILAEKKA